MDNGELIRVVPAKSGGAATDTMGTEVFVGNQKITGVTGITLHCELNDVWRATVECVVIPPEVDAVAEYRYPGTLLEHLREWWKSRG